MPLDTETGSFPGWVPFPVFHLVGGIAVDLRQGFVHNHPSLPQAQHVGLKLFLIVQILIAHDHRPPSTVDLHENILEGSPARRIKGAEGFVKKKKL